MTQTSWIQVGAMVLYDIFLAPPTPGAASGMCSGQRPGPRQLGCSWPWQHLHTCNCARGWRSISWCLSIARCAESLHAVVCFARTVQRCAWHTEAEQRASSINVSQRDALVTS